MKTLAFSRPQAFPYRTTVVAVLVALCAALLPVGALGAQVGAPSNTPSAKFASLRLSDVQHVFHGTFTAGAGRYGTPHAMGVCTSTPPASVYTSDIYGSLRTKGVSTVISQIYTYKSKAGPRCNQQYEIGQVKVLGHILGRMYNAGGAGEEAFILDTTGPKSPGPAVYTLALKFTRGLYRAIIIVQSGRTISRADMIKLGKIVDGRMKHTG